MGKLTFGPLNNSSPYLYQATRSLVDLYRVLMPVYHERTLTDVPALTILFYNDCMYIARELEKMTDRLENGIPGMDEVLYDDAIPPLKALAKKWLDIQVVRCRDFHTIGNRFKSVTLN